MSEQRQVGILLFDAVDVLDFSGPFEVFVIAGRLLREQNPFRVFTVAEHAAPVLTRGRLSVNPRYTFQDCPPLDVLVVPGGAGVRREEGNFVLLDWLRKRAGQAEIVLAVSTGVFLLAQAGVVDGLEVTTHRGALDALQRTAPGALVRSGVRLVDSGRIVTSAGISAGIDAALHVVGRLLGPQVAEQTAQAIEYAWAPLAAANGVDAPSALP